MRKKTRKIALAVPRRQITAGTMLLATFTILASLLQLSVSPSGAIGGVDATFGTNGHVAVPSITGRVFLPAEGNVFATQSTGKLLIVGYSATPACGTITEQASNACMSVMRLNTNGSIDTSFGVGGFATYRPSSGKPQWRSLAVASDDSFVVAGCTGATDSCSFEPYLQPGQFGTAVRFTASGVRDASFGDGHYQIALGPSDGPLTGYVGNTTVFSTAAIQPDGKIVLVGTSGFFESDARVITGTWAVATRLNSDGTTDTSFGQSGFVAFDIRPSAINLPWRPTGMRGSFTDVKISTVDGSIFIAGFGANWDSKVIKLNSVGVVDTAFATDTTINELDYSKIAILSSGKVVSAGATGIRRLLTDGSIDISWGINGVAYWAGLDPIGCCRDLDINSSGQVFASLDYSPPNINYIATIGKLTSSGLPDTSWGHDGLVHICDSDSAGEYAIGIAVGNSSSLYTLTRIRNATSYVKDGFSITRLVASGGTQSPKGCVPNVVPNVAASGLVSTNPAMGVAVVSFDDPDSTYPILDYTVVAQPGGRRTVVSGNQNTATIGGLANGTSYTFKVTARSKAGSSEQVISNSAVPYSYPAAVNTLSVTAITSSSVATVGVNTLLQKQAFPTYTPQVSRTATTQFKFQPGSSRGRPITAYQISCATPGETYPRSNTSTGGIYGWKFISVPNMTKGKTYTCSVRAKNLAGLGDVKKIVVTPR